jgi:hypothetical protein
VALMLTLLQQHSRLVPALALGSLARWHRWLVGTVGSARGARRALYEAT